MDFVQVLDRLSKEKEEVYPKGCLEAVQAVVEYFRVKMDIKT